jgi:hypothetical protein
MKPNNDPRHDLLDDLYSPAGPDSKIAAENVATWVEEARRSRHLRRKRVQLGGAVAIVGVIAAVAFRVLLPDPIDSTSNQATNQRSESNSSTIHLLGDDELLRLIETTPAAMAKWPDGRRSLLLLVGAENVPDGD